MPQKINSAQQGTTTLGYAESTTPQTGIGAADLTGLTTTVTVSAGERIKITGYVPFDQSTGDNYAELSIMEGATVITQAMQAQRIAGHDNTVIAIAVITPTAGSHTYKLRMATFTGTTSTLAAATRPCFILVERI